MSFAVARPPTPGSERRCGWHAAPQRSSPECWRRRSWGRPSAANAAPAPARSAGRRRSPARPSGSRCPAGRRRLPRDRGQPGRARADGHGDAGAPGLLTLPARPIDVPVDRVDAVLTLAAAATRRRGRRVDVRGLRRARRMDGVGARRAVRRRTRTLTAALPDPVVDGARRASCPRRRPRGVRRRRGPVVRTCTLTAARRGPPAATAVEARPAAVPGLRHPGGPRRRHDRERPRHHRAGPVRRPALPPGPLAAQHQRLHGEGVRPRPAAARSRRSGTSARGTPATTTGTPPPRQNWRDLPAGLPRGAGREAAGLQRRQGPVRPDGASTRPGIDLADGLFWDALGLKDNAWVTSTTCGPATARWRTVPRPRRVDLHGAPDATAPRRRARRGGGGGAAPVRDGHLAAGRGRGSSCAASAVPPQQWPRHLPRCSG